MPGDRDFPVRDRRVVDRFDRAQLGLERQVIELLSFDLGAMQQQILVHFDLDIEGHSSARTSER